MSEASGGLSRRDFSVRLSVDEGTLARWEQGVARPAGTRLQRVKGFLATSELSAPTRVQ